MSIKNILLDLDDTILDFKKAERAAFLATMEAMGIFADETIAKRYSEINLAQWKLLEQGRLTRGEVKVRRYMLLFKELGMEKDPLLAAKLYEARLGVGHYFMDGAEEAIEVLSKKYSLYIASNGTARVQRSRMESAGLYKYMKGVFISEEIGEVKPDRAFFEKCFAAIEGFTHENTIMVGDSITSDIKGGRDAGIKTVLVAENAPCGDVMPNYIIKSITELSGLIEKIS